MFLFVIYLIVLLSWFYTTVADLPPLGSVFMKIINHAHQPIRVYWINEFVQPVTYIEQTSKPIRNGSETSISSYDTHKFIVRYANSPDSGGIIFTKGSNDERIVVIMDKQTSSLKVSITTKVEDVVDSMIKSMQTCQRKYDDDFISCISSTATPHIYKIIHIHEATSRYLTYTSSKLRNYICAEDDIKSTHPIDSYHTQLDHQEFTVNVLLNFDSAKIWYVDDFITKEECNILIKHSLPRLERAAVVGVDGHGEFSENRKAQQASYEYREGGVNNPLWNLSQRVLSMINSHANMSLSYEGQEEFTIIQYNVDDEYKPHCDGECDGSKHYPGGRVATALMYCEVPKRGGATVFTKSDIVIQPKPGAATFFSFMGSDGTMDEGGFTEHSGCPIIEGEKWIITFWMREGVSAKEPHTLFDTSGIRLQPENITDTFHHDKDENRDHDDSDQQSMIINPDFL